MASSRASKFGYRELRSRKSVCGSQILDPRKRSDELGPARASGRGRRTKTSLFPSATNRDPQASLGALVFSARPARGSGVGSPGRRIDSRKGVGNSAPRETFRTGCRKARAESRFRWRTKRQPVRGTLSPFEPPPRAAVPVDAPPPVDIQLGIAARDPTDETADESMRLDSAHLILIGVISDGAESSTLVGVQKLGLWSESSVSW
jgi:hypothetical protein